MKFTMAGAAWPFTRVPITSPSAQNGNELSKLTIINFDPCSMVKSTPPKPADAADAAALALCYLAGAGMRRRVQQAVTR